MRLESPSGPCEDIAAGGRRSKPVAVKDQRSTPGPSHAQLPVRILTVVPAYNLLSMLRSGRFRTPHSRKSVLLRHESSTDSDPQEFLDIDREQRSKTRRQGHHCGARACKRGDAEHQRAAEQDAARIVGQVSAIAGSQQATVRHGHSDRSCQRLAFAVAFPRFGDRVAV
jgi:hypothetical protein